MKLSEWIKVTQPESNGKCSTCANKALAKTVAEFHAARKSKRTAVTWAQFRRQFLEPNGFRVQYSTMLLHVRNCLGGIV